MKDLCIEDNYLKEFDAVVESVKDDKFIVLNQTAFYPNAGGQPYDTGIMKTEDGKEYEVVFVGKFDEKISHEVDNKENPPLKENDNVHCTIDWDRRYKLMRMHTAAHILSRVLHQKTGAVTSGNQLGIDKSRIDFTLKPKRVPCSCSRLKILPVESIGKFIFGESNSAWVPLPEPGDPNMMRNVFCIILIHILS